MHKTKSKLKIFLVVLLAFLAYFAFSLLNQKEDSISSITISYANSIPFTTSRLYDLVDLNTLNTNFLIELRYASENNFAKKQIYPKISKAYLKESTANKLMAANEEFYKLGYRIKVLDAYRPRKYQYILREAANEINPKTQGYIADPDIGSNHNKGVSVDITLTDLEGRELDMPTEFDHFGSEASINYSGCSETQKNNRELLGKIMVKHGFRRISSEWWHFDDTDYLDYPLLDIDFIELYQ